MGEYILFIKTDITQFSLEERISGMIGSHIFVNAIQKEKTNGYLLSRKELHSHTK